MMHQPVTSTLANSTPGLWDQAVLRAESAVGTTIAGMSLPVFISAALLTLGVVMLGVWIAVNARRPSDPRQRAFHALAWRMRLGPAGRQAVADLARAHGKASPVALLVSRHAMTEAVTALRARADVPAPVLRRVERLEQRFGLAGSM